MTFRELDKLLRQSGWENVRTRGSHFHYKHPDKDHTITVPNHNGRDISTGTAKSILKQAGLK